ncbi:MAG: cytochrome-c peroxidase [Deltaproteobacteria bacterium]|nr:cytochrome-c peroxidase [Deltaproteobacteria bacterium]
MKRFVILLVVVALIALAVPIANLFIGNPKGTTVTRSAASDDRLVAVATILETKCANCHSTEAQLPFYAAFPVAGDMIRGDKQAGIREFDLVTELYPTGKGPATEPALAKIEYVAQTGAMPPARYLALHWNHRLSDVDRETLTPWIRETRRGQYATAKVPPEVQALAVQPLPNSVAVDARKADLGKRLYHDTRLSGDNTISCASCHALDKGGTDNAKVSTGIRGQLGGINAPTTYNALFQFKQFWDGRAGTLAEQAGGPPLNPVEMGSNWPEIIGKLEADEAFAREFRQAYPDGFSQQTITDAIAAFEQTLLTPDSRFDRFLLGQVNALTPEERRGWDLFRQHGCQTCHVGKLLGGQSFEIMGLRADYFKDRGTPLTDADKGRFNVTKNERDRHRLKVPTLRNVAKTAPYLHDGSAADLPAAVRAMARYQVGATLPEADVTAIAEFLESLTGTYQGKPL